MRYEVFFILGSFWVFTFRISFSRVIIERFYLCVIFIVELTFLRIVVCLVLGCEGFREI